MTVPNPAVESKICVECGAENWAYAADCWLCKRDLSDVEAVVNAEIVAPPVSTSANTFFAVVTGILGIVLVLIGIGLYLEEPGAAIGYMILVIPPLIATIVRTMAKQGERPVGWGERLATFLISSVVFFGILVMLCIAAVVAFFAICLAAIANA